jgi:hypothetical protein
MQPSRIGAGLGAALLLTRFLDSILFGLKPTDPLTLAARRFYCSSFYRCNAGRLGTVAQSVLHPTGGNPAS